MEHTVTVLHISDLHARGSRETESWRRCRVIGEENWRRNLDDLRRDGAIDLVCFTGDLAHSGQPDDYKGAGEFLDFTLRHLDLPSARLAVVPGNHDIDRAIEPSAWQTLRRNIHRFDPLEISRWLAGNEAPFGFTDDAREKILQRQAAFRNWLSAANLNHLLPQGSPHGRLGFRHTLRIPGQPFDVQLIGLDSAWLCGDDSDEGRLLLTADQVLRLTSDSQGRALPGLRLALIHHPLSVLADSLPCRRLMTGRVDVLLRGHLHEAEAALWADPERSLHQVVAGCLYAGTNVDSPPQMCVVVRIVCDDAGRPKRYELRVRSFSERNGQWRDDAGAYPEATGGRFTTQLSVPQPLASPPTSAPAFVGRQMELRRLAKELLPSPDRETLRPVVLVGSAGVGKSALARQFFHHHRDEFPGGLIHLNVLAISGGIPDARDLGLQLADQIGLQSSGLVLQEALLIRLRQPRSLLLLDDVDSEQAARTVGEFVEAFPDCSILITSRHSGLGASQGWLQISVGSLSETEALQLLSEQLPALDQRLERKESIELLRALGFMPVAIQLALGYLRHGGSVASLLHLLKSKELEGAPEKLADQLREYSTELVTIQRSIQVAVDQLRVALGQNSERLLAGLSAFAWLPSAFVGPDLASSIAGLPPQEFEQLMSVACQLALVEQREDGKRYGLHPAVARFLRSEAAREPSKQRLDAWFLERLPESPSNATGQGRRWEAIHAERDMLTAWLAGLPAAQASQVVRSGTHYAQLAGPFRAWARLCEQGLREKGLSNDDREQLLILLCVALEQAGQTQQAEQIAEELCAFAQQSGDGLLFAMGKDQIAVCRIQSGRLQEALGILRADVLPVYEKNRNVRLSAIAQARVAGILTEQGHLDEALQIRREQLIPIFRTLGDKHSYALTIAGIAEIHEHRGQLDEALRLRAEVELPLHEELGDRLGRAITLGAIALIRQRRGQLDEALRIYQNEELPTYERMGDFRLAAQTRGKIATIHQDRGQLDEALRIYTEDLLPFYEKIADHQMVSNTLSRIIDIYRKQGQLTKAASILHGQSSEFSEQLGNPRTIAFLWGQEAKLCRDRGQLDEALRIRQQKELPIYEQLGEWRSHAVAMGEIADIYQDKGELARALQIREEEELPFYKKQGYAKQLALAMGKIAGIRERQGQLDEAERILKRDVVPLFERHGYQRHYAVALRQLARVLKAQGQLDAAVELLESKSLPLLERLQIAPPLARTRYALAQALLQREHLNDRERAKGLLADAYGALAPQGFAVAERFRALQLRHGFLKLGVLPVHGAEIENVRGIASLKLPLHKRLTVLYGRNATGKSTVLDALAFGLTAVGQLFCEQERPRAFGSSLLRQTWPAGEEAPHIATHCRATLMTEEFQWAQTLWRRDQQAGDTETNTATDTAALMQRLLPTLNAIRNGKGAWDTLPVFAYYGVERAVDKQTQHGATVQLEIQRTDAMNDALDAQSRFQSAVNWFYTQEARERKEREERKNPNHRSAALDAVRGVLEQAVPGCRNPRISNTPERLLVDFERPDKKVEMLDLGQLSDGYRTHLALVLDLARRMVQANPPPPEPQPGFLWGVTAPAIVLIDEVDLHLHPAWQQTVVPGLLSAFPNTQFVITTHSDQVLSSCPIESWTWEMYREGDSIAIRRPAVPLAGASSEQVLEVGMEVPARAAAHEFVKLLREYELLVYDGRFGDAKARELRMQLDGIRPDDPGLMDADAEIDRQRLFSDEPAQTSTAKPK